MENIPGQPLSAEKGRISLSALRYYLSSIPKILTQIENWYEIARILFGSRRVVIRLRNGYRFKVRSLMDVWIIKETCLDRVYGEIPESDVPWTVVDIGAGIGDFATLVARKLPKASVFAFEPLQDSFELLKDNIAQNRADNVRPSRLAVGGSSGFMHLFSEREVVQATTVRRTGSVVSEGGIQVQGTSLDELFQENKISRCDLLKLDCEGAEFDILLNASPATLHRVDRIRLEYHNGYTPFSHQDLARHLGSHGFEVKVSANPVHSHLGYLYADRQGLGAITRGPS